MNIGQQRASNSVVPLFRRLAILLLASIAIVGAFVWGMETVRWPQFVRRITWLNIDEVKISSEWPLDVSTVKGWLPPLEGQSILAVQGADVVQALKAKRWVDWVTVKKEYPNRLVIEVGTKRAQAIEVTKGHSYFVDADGERIEATTPTLLTALDLPVVTKERGKVVSPWAMSDIVGVLDRFQKQLSSRYVVSQVVLGSYPFFKVFLSRPQLEVSLSFENWDSQLPILALLLHSPPRQIGQPQRINLILPKKAVVSSTLSH